MAFVSGNSPSIAQAPFSHSRELASVSTTKRCHQSKGRGGLDRRKRPSPRVDSSTFADRWAAGPHRAGRRNGPFQVGDEALERRIPRDPHFTEVSATKKPWQRSARIERRRSARRTSTFIDQPLAAERRRHSPKRDRHPPTEPYTTYTGAVPDRCRAERMPSGVETASDGSRFGRIGGAAGHLESRDRRGPATTRRALLHRRCRLAP